MNFCCAACGMRFDDPRHEITPDGCRARTVHGEDDQ